VTPKFMRLSADFYVRGGIYTSVVAECRSPGWVPAAQIQLP
jgi:7-cyano-7-deazaguanine reductase